MTKRIQRRKRLRAKIYGTDNRPRISIFRSNRAIYLQAIDDSKGKTLVASSTLVDKDNMTKNFAFKLNKLKIKKVVFDRGGYQYHGKIKKVADELRTNGLEF